MSDAPMPIALLSWKPLDRNSLRGFATVRLGRSLSITDVAVHSSGGKRWASLPSKPVVTKEGMVQKTDAGKTKFVPLLAWLDRASADKFSQAVIAAVEADYGPLS